MERREPLIDLKEPAPVLGGWLVQPVWAGPGWQAGEVGEPTALEDSLLLGEVSLLFYAGLRLIGGGPPTLWSAICFAQLRM